MSASTDKKIRRLAGLAGWEPFDHLCDDPECIWRGTFEKDGVVDIRDYPNSLDAIERDLLPILRERGWRYDLYWNGYEHVFIVYGCANKVLSQRESAAPAAAAMEAIFEALQTRHTDASD